MSLKFFIIAALSLSSVSATAACATKSSSSGFELTYCPISSTALNITFVGPFSGSGWVSFAFPDTAGVMVNADGYMCDTIAMLNTVHIPSNGESSGVVAQNIGSAVAGGSAASISGAWTCHFVVNPSTDTRFSSNANINWAFKSGDPTGYPEHSRQRLNQQY